MMHYIHVNHLQVSLFAFLLLLFFKRVIILCFPLRINAGAENSLHNIVWLAIENKLIYLCNTLQGLCGGVLSLTQ